MSALSSDSLPKVDLLKREKFAKQIANSLVSSFSADESLVIGICGKWGSGKTTLLSYIENELSNNKSQSFEYCIVKFNPWANTDIDELQRDLLGNILKKLEKVNWKEKAKSANDTFKKYLNYLNYIKFVKHVHPVARNIVDAVNEYNKKVSVISIEDLKSKINQLLKEKEVKLFVFVDDLDRLEPDEVIAILRTIKLQANFANTFYLISYDKKVVIECLRDKFKGNAESYLEKIIQVDFNVPEILEEDIESIFFSRLDKLFEKHAIKEDKAEIFSIWKWKGLREYFKNLRDINRYFNSLELSLPNIKGDVNISDFITLEAIKVFDFGAYNDLYTNILELRRKAVYESVSIGASVTESIKNGITKSLLLYLFNNSSKQLKREGMVHKRLMDSEYFQRYFTLYLPSKDVSEEHISQYLLSESNKHNVLNNCLDEDKLDNLLRRLSDREIVSKYKNIDNQAFLNLITYFDPRDQVITESRFQLIWSAFFNLIHSCKDQYGASLECVRALEMSMGSITHLKLAIIHFVLNIYDKKYKDNYLKGEVEKQCFLHIGKLKKSLIDNLKKNYSFYFSKIAAGNENWVCQLALYSYAKHDKVQYLEDVKSYFDSPAFLFFLLRNNFVLNSDKVTKECITMDRKDIFFTVTSFGEFISRLRRIKQGQIKEDQMEIVKLFLESIDQN